MTGDDATIFDEDYFLRGKQTGKSNFSDYRWLPSLTIPVCKLIMRYLGGVPSPPEKNSSVWKRANSSGDSVLDYGCARGYYVKALRGLGYDAWGYDISEWAIANCDESISKFVSTTLPQLTAGGPRSFDFILAKDVLEHIEEAELGDVIRYFIEHAHKAAFIIVPLAAEDGGLFYSGTVTPAQILTAGETRFEPRIDANLRESSTASEAIMGAASRCFVSPVDRTDVTHKIAWTLSEWLLFIQGIIDESGRAFTVTGSYKMPGVKRAADPWPCSCGFILLKRFEYE